MATIIDPGSDPWKSPWELKGRCLLSTAACLDQLIQIPTTSNGYSVISRFMHGCLTHVARTWCKISSIPLRPPRCGGLSTRCTPKAPDVLLEMSASSREQATGYSESASSEDEHLLESNSDLQGADEKKSGLDIFIAWCKAEGQCGYNIDKAPDVLPYSREQASGYSESASREDENLLESNSEPTSREIFFARNEGIGNVITVNLLEGQHVKQPMKYLKINLLFGAFMRTVRLFRVIVGAGESELKTSEC